MFIDPRSPSHQGFSKSHGDIELGMNLIPFLIIVNPVKSQSHCQDKAIAHGSNLDALNLLEGKELN